MNKAIAIGVAAGLAVLAGCENKAEPAVETTYMPQTLEIKKGNHVFTAYEHAGKIHANLRHWFAIDYHTSIDATWDTISGDFEVESVWGRSTGNLDCKDTKDIYEAERCNSGKDMIYSLCDELDCSRAYLDWTRLRPSGMGGYISL